MKRHALFAGVNTYDDKAIRPLRYSIPDASVLADRFGRLGFQTCLLPDPTRQQLLAAVEDATEGLGRGDVFLFFFAGHGFTAQDGAHLLFCRDDRKRMLRVNSAGIRVDALELLTGEGGFHRAFLLDSCRSDAFADEDARGEETRDLDLVAMPETTDGGGTFFLLRSCDRFQPSLEISGFGHGLFTQGLLEAMDAGEPALALCGDAFTGAVREHMDVLARRESIAARQRPASEINGPAFPLFRVGVFGTAATASSKPEAVPECATCGRRLTASVDQFKCRKCGKRYCFAHQDPEYLLCGDCAAAKRAEKKKAEEAAVAAKKAAEEKAVRRREEEEALRWAEEAWETAEEERKGREEAARKATEAAARRQEEQKETRVSDSQEGQTGEWNVRLAAIGPRNVALVKEIRELTGLGVKEAKELVESAPRNVKENVSRDEAKRIQRLLESTGASVELEESKEGAFRPGSFANVPGRVENAPRGPLARVGRNDPCPCGSGKKYKKCCGQDEGPRWAATVQSGRCAGETKTIVLPGGAEMEMVWCPPGSFMMGSPENEQGRMEDEGDDETQHRVTLTQGFWMGKYPVTQQQWKSVMGNKPLDFTGNSQPVWRVSWDDCVTFCQKAGHGLQLPTEAQWEYACRAGSTGAYAGTGRLDDMGWYEGNHAEEEQPHPHPVGQKRPNEWGLCDMHGNVPEWCADWFAPYPVEAVTDPKGPSTGSCRVLRGGGWGNYAYACRSAYRGALEPKYWECYYEGFRLCCSEQRP